MAQSINIVHEMINKVGFEFNEADAKKVSDLAEKAAELAASKMTKELSSVVKEIGEIFNKALGKNTIDFSDLIKAPDNNAIKTLTERFVSQLQIGISKGVGKGGSDGVNSVEFISKEDMRLAEEAYERLYHRLFSIRNEAAEAEKKLEKLQKTASVYGFGLDKSDAQQGRIQSTLAKDGRNQYVIDMLKKGYKTTKTKSGEYGFDRPDLGQGVYTKITKTEYEYAQYLSQKIQELNVGWNEGLRILQSQNGELEVAQAKVETLRAEEKRIQQEKEAAYEAQTRAHNLWAKQKGGSKSSAESQNTETAANKQIAASYDELKAKVEAYYKAKQRVIDIADKRQSGDILSEMEEVNVAEKDLLKYFDGKDVDISSMLKAPDSTVEGTLEHISKLLGVEVPMAAKNAAEAISGVVAAKEIEAEAIKNKTGADDRLYEKVVRMLEQNNDAFADYEQLIALVELESLDEYRNGLSVYERARLLLEEGYVRPETIRPDAVNTAEKSIDNVVEAVQAAKRELAASSTTLGILNGENEYGPTINTIKEKQKTLKGYLNELTAVVKKEKENGELTEEEIARKQELTDLINRLDLAVRYQDGSYFQTGDANKIGFNEDGYHKLDTDEFLAQLEQLNQIVNLRKKIALGYYNTDTYDTYEDTFNGDKVKNLVTSAIWARDDGDTEQFNASMIGQLTREYQYLHEQMLKCMLVGEEVPKDAIDRMKWFENISTEDLSDALPRLTELQQKIDEIRHKYDGSIFSWRYNADDKYYDDKIQDLQTLIALQEEYVKLGGPTDNLDERDEPAKLKSHIDLMEKLKQASKDAIRLKEQFANIDLDKHSTTKNQLAWLSQGDISYDSAVQNINQWIEDQREQKEKLTSKLKGLSAESEDIGELQSNLKEREKIYLQLQREQLLTEDIQRNYDAVNKEITEKIALLGKVAQAEREVVKKLRQGASVYEGGKAGESSNSNLNDALPSTDTTAEVQNLENVRKKVEDIKTEVEAKTGAFTAEETEVKRVAEAEIEALKPLEQKVKDIQTAIKGLDEQMPTDAPAESVDTPQTPLETSPETKPEIISEEELAKLAQLRDQVKVITGEIKSTINNVVTDEAGLQKSIRNITAQIHSAIVAERGQLGKLNSDIEKTSTNLKGLFENITSGETNIAAGLSNINVTVNHPQTQQNDLEAVLKTVADSLEDVDDDKEEPHEENSDKKTAKEKTLQSIARSVKRIRRSISASKSDKTLDVKSDIVATTQEHTHTTASDYVGSTYFPLKLDTQSKALEKIRAQLIASGKATTEFTKRIDLLQSELKQVQNGVDFSEWNQKFHQLKLDIGIDNIFSKKEAEENAKIYQKILSLKQEQYQIEKDIEKAEDGSQAKIVAQQQFDNLQRQIETQRSLLLYIDQAYESKIASESQKHQRSQARHEASAADKKPTDFEQLEIEYKKLGKLQAQLDAADATKKFAITNEINQQKELIEKKREELTIIRELTKEESKKLERAKLDAEIEEWLRLAPAKMKNQMTAARQQARVSKMTSTYNKGDDTIGSLWRMDDIEVEELMKLPDVAKLQEALVALQQTKTDVLKSISDTGQFDEAKFGTQIKTAVGEVTRYSQAIKELIANYEFFSGDNSTDLGRKLSPGEDIKTQLIEATQALHGGKIKVQKYDAATQQLTYTVKSGEYEFTNYTAGVRDVDKALRTVQGTTKKTETMFELIGRKTKDVLTYFSGSTIIYKGIEELRKGIQYVREIDAALTELKKVTNETEASYDRFLNTASKTADKVGSTIAEVVGSTADFARLGYNLSEAAQMAESAQILMNVSEFDDISSATDSLISAIQAFSYTADQSLHVVDILNTIGNKYAISTSDLAESLTRSSAALVAAGNTMEEAVALTAAANTIIQNSESVGNALKTVSMRIRGTTTKELEAAGEDTDGLVENTSKLYSKIKALTAVGGKEGISILGDDGKYLNTYEILTKIADRWEEITEVGNDAALLELIAGKTRGSVVAALLQQPETLKKAYGDALNADGSALRENEKHLDSIQGRIDQFTNSVQTMWSNTLHDEWIKWFVEAGTVIIKVIDAFDLLKVAIAGAFAVFNHKRWKIDFIASGKSLIESLFDPKSIEDATKQLNKLKDTAERANQVFKTDPTNEAYQIKNEAEGRLYAYEARAKTSFEKRKEKLVTKAKRLEVGIASQRPTIRARRKAKKQLTHPGSSDDVMIYKSYTEEKLKEINENAKRLEKSKAFEIMGKQAADVKGEIAKIDELLGKISGDTQSNNQQLSADIFQQANFSKEKLQIDDMKLFASELDKLNTMDNSSVANYIQSVVDLGDKATATQKSIAAYASTVQDGNYSVQAGTTFVNTHNVALKSSSIAAKAAAIGYSALNAAITMGLSIAIQFLIEGLTKLIGELYKLATPTVHLGEKLSELNSELSDTQSELDALNSELQTTQERMAELLALPSLSFTEKEELENLRKQNAELERQIALKKSLKDSQESKIAETNKDYIDTVWNSTKTDKAYYIDDKGVIHKDEWNKTGINTKTALNKAMIAYESEEIYAQAKKELEESGKLSDDTYEKIVIGADNIYNTKEDVEKYRELPDWLKISDEDLVTDFYTDVVEKSKDKKADIAKGINLVFGDENFANMEYGDDKEINAFLDELYAYSYKWQNVQGKSANSSAIASIFDDTASSELQALETALQNISSDDSLTLDDKNSQIAQKINNAYASTEEGYERLKTMMDTVGIKSDEIANYFTLGGGVSDFSALDVKIEEIGRAGQTLEELLSGGKFNIEGAELGLVDLFDEEGKLAQDKLSQIFNNTSAKTREDITSLLEGSYDDIKNGTTDISALMEKFALTSNQQILEISRSLLIEQNEEMFPGLKDEISGIIDTFDELTSAVGSVVDAMDALDQARAEEAYSGSVSLETLQNLMQHTTDYSKIVSVDETGAIHLAANAQEILIQEKIEAIKANAEQAYQEALTTYQLAEQANTANEAGDSLYNGYLTVVDQVAGGLAYVGSVAGAVWSAIKGEGWTSWSDVLSNASNARTQAIGNREKKRKTEYVDAKAALELAENNRKIANALTVDNIKSKYDSDTASGGASNKDEAENNKLQEDMDYWERQIAANQAKYEQVQNEIDLLEKKGQRAGADYYRKQIELETERKDLLEQQKADATKRLWALTGAGKKGSDEWWEVANILNDIEGNLDDVTASIQDSTDAIHNLKWDNLEEIHNRFSDILDDISDIRDVLSDEDMFDDEGNFTESGVAILGTHIDEYRWNKKAADDIMNGRGVFGDDDYIPGLNEFLEKNYASNEDYFRAIGIDSEQEYNDKKRELTDYYNTYVKAAKDSEKSVVEVYENQIDAVEEYTSKLIDGYNDYIDVCKEALDAERDLHDFKRNVEKQTKDIASLERRIASLSGSTNAADIAERKRLEAELYESKQSLNDTYYDHAKDAQSNALDEEATAYETAMNNYVEGLRTTLDQATLDMATFMEQVITAVSLNAEIVENKYHDTGLAISKDLTDPWAKAKEAMAGYEGEDGLGLMNKWLADGEFFDKFKKDTISDLKAPWDAGKAAASAFETSATSAMDNIVSNIQSNVVTAKEELNKLYAEINKINTTEIKPKVTGQTTTTTRQTQTTTTQDTQPKGYYVEATLPENKYNNLKGIGKNTDKNKAISAAKLSLANQFRNYQSHAGKDDAWIEKTWQRVYSSKIHTKISQYAKGTTGTTKDEWAVTDEPWLGDELTMYATPEGRLSYMRAGSTVVPADATREILKLADIGVNGLMAPKLNSGITLMSNAINKPEINLSFEALVKAERIDENTLPEVKRFVRQEINSLVKQMNYAIKGVGGR